MFFCNATSQLIDDKHNKQWRLVFQSEILYFTFSKTETFLQFCKKTIVWYGKKVVSECSYIFERPTNLFIQFGGNSTLCYVMLFSLQRFFILLCVLKSHKPMHKTINANLQLQLTQHELDPLLGSVQKWIPAESSFLSRNYSLSSN